MNVSANIKAYSKLMSKSHGDYMFENQLIDREFYKRERIFTQSRKEARTLDRFEQ